jgi:hypothetical protein
MPEKNKEENTLLLETADNLPQISLIIPFESKMNKKSELDYMLTTAADKIEKELKESYPEEKAMPVIKKLRTLIKGFNYTEHRKSIAIFISPVTEKVYYFQQRLL